MMKCHFNLILSTVWLRIWFRLYDTCTVIINTLNVWEQWFPWFYDIYFAIKTTRNTILNTVPTGINGLIPIIYWGCCG